MFVTEKLVASLACQPILYNFLSGASRITDQVFTSNDFPTIFRLLAVAGNQCDLSFGVN